jgi:hypothetical protein
MMVKLEILTGQDIKPYMAICMVQTERFQRVPILI